MLPLLDYWSFRSSACASEYFWEFLLRHKKHRRPALIRWPPFLIVVNTPPAKAGGFGLRLKAGSIGPSADSRRYTTVKSSSGSGGF
jgi:hypothetical protein